MLAMLRWTKMSPGRSPTIWFAGTRLSAQPIHRYDGVCWRESLVKNSGSWRWICSDHSLLRLKSSSRVRMWARPYYPAQLLAKTASGGRAQLESYDAGDDGDHARDPQRCRGLVEQDHAENHRAHRADTHPDRVGGSHGQGFHREAQQEHAADHRSHGDGGGNRA